MGISPQKQKLKQNQIQVIEQNYSNNIMLMTLSTLQSITRMIMGKKNTSDKKKYGQNDRVDYGNKSMVQLLSQFRTHLFLLKISKQQMEKDFKTTNGFIFPKNLPKEAVLKDIQIFKMICMKSNITQLIESCDDFSNIIKGSYHNLNFQKSKGNLQYSQSQKAKHRNNLMKDGIDATVVMNQLQEEVLRQGINNPNDLNVKMNIVDMQYEQALKLSKQNY